MPVYRVRLELRVDHGHRGDLIILQRYLNNIGSRVKVRHIRASDFSLNFDSTTNCHADGSGARAVREAFREICRQMASQRRIVWELNIGQMIVGAENHGGYTIVHQGYGNI